MKPGAKAPAFTLFNQDGKSVKLSSFKGRKVLLFFYPKAMTPGCTDQACSLRDNMQGLEARDTVVLGVSPDAPDRLLKFKEKYGLNFDLLSDETHSVAELYGVWGLKKFMGREFMGILRTSFLIDENGKIAEIFDKVKTKTHGTDVIDYLKA